LLVPSIRVLLRRLARGAALAGLLAVAACGTAPPDPTPGAVAVPHSPVPAGSAAPSAPASQSTDPDITLEFAGDVHFQDRVAKLLDNPQATFGPIASTLASADLTMVNLETAVTSRGTEQPKEFHFRTTPVALDAIRAAGIDVVTLANNHVLDYGQVGLADTLTAVKAANLPYVGIGNNTTEAWAPYLVTIKGRKIAILGVSQVDELQSTWVATDTRPGEAHAIDLTHTLGAVKAAKQQADLVLVFMHWGTEGDGCPNAAQKSLAPKLAAAGADIIIGAHAHTLQGSGWLGRTFVAYGMANFLWWQNSYSTETGILRLTLHRNAPLTAEFLPAIVSSTGQPVLATGADQQRIANRYAGLRACAGLTAAPAA
jgi:poly-gamma-glutamate capsule biosynthesis protein CapA/YwtB (metallophosphatase superfamily)